jgi:hypothetical protein
VLTEDAKKTERDSDVAVSLLRAALEEMTKERDRLRFDLDLALDRLRESRR